MSFAVAVASSVSRRVFPIPGAPVRRTTRPRPEARSERTLCSAASSRSRPTIGAVAVRGSRSFARMSCAARTGSSRPFTVTSTGAPRTKRCSRRRAADVTDEDRSGVGRRLEARCDVRRVAERDRLGIGAAHEPHRRRPAVHTDPYGEPRDPPRRLDVARVPADDLEDAQGRARRALGIVLVRGWNAEVRADPVALVRLHDAAVLVDRTAHHRHALAYEHLRLVGLEPLAERRRADDVGEEHGDGATLVLHPTRSRRGGRRGSRYRVRPARHRGRCEGRDGSERVVLAQDGLLELA